jgi:hypothetical protein
VYIADTVYDHIGNTRVTIGYFPPRLDTIVPNWGYERSEVDVTLTGHNVDAGNFNTPVRVNVSGGITATVQSIDPTTLHARFQIPDNLTGQQQVTITSTHGTSNPLNFIAVDRQPQITGISPSTIDAGTAASVTIDGTDFGVNPDVEILGGAQYSITSRSDTRIVVNVSVPVDSPGGDLLFTVISRGANGTGFLPGPPNTSPRSNTENIQVQALRVTIASNLIGVPKNDTAEVEVTLSPSPSNASVTLRLSKTSGDSGEARFASNNSTTLVINQSTTVSIKGITESDTANNIRLVAMVGSPGSELASRSFSVVWVTLELRISDKVSDDNGSKSLYVDLFGRDTLGTFLGSGTLPPVWGTAVEIVGKVFPSNYSDLLTLSRIIVEGKNFRDQTEVTTVPPNTDDTSDSRLRDDDPQSGNSRGKIYDLDSPGFSANAPEGTIIRKRGNFTQYATIQVYQGGNLVQAKCSSDLKWYTALSIRKTSTGDVLHTQPEVIDDNKAGLGTINVTWNLKPAQ